MKGDIPIGTKFIGSGDTVYVRTETGFERYEGKDFKDSISLTNHPEWSIMATWRGYDIEIPKENLFDNLYKRML